jgi:hypothetical protein
MKVNLERRYVRFQPPAGVRRRDFFYSRGNQTGQSSMAESPTIRFKDQNPVLKFSYSRARLLQIA